MRFFGALAALLALAAAATGQVNVWEDTLTLPTYAWYDDPNPAFCVYEDAIYYPYSRQDLIAKSKEDRGYRAVYLENEFLKVTCTPELGGRIYSVLDKTTNEEMFHKNDEVKPALIAMRGAWISGGIEWNPGPQGHTVTVVSPVDVTTAQHPDGSASLIIGNTEKMFRTRWTVVLTLHPGKAYLDENIRIFNPTDGIHPYYFWNCTAFPSRPGTRFIYPMTLGSDHAGTTFFEWPVDKGRDLTWLKNYPTMSSIFAYECVFDFFGGYDVEKNRGIVSYANHRVVRGKKAWTWGTDDFGVVSQMGLSDAGREGAPYIEVQSGPLLTQADYGMLRPHQEVAWNEFWYPIHGLGDGFEYATRDLAVQTARTAQQGLELRLLATAVYPQAVFALTQGERVLLESKIDLSPAQPVVMTLPNPPDGPIRVRVFSAQKESLLDYETPLAIPKVTEPDLTKKPARTDGVATADEKFNDAFLLDSQSSREGARKGYEAVLLLDPAHVKALCALAELDIECGQFKAAEAGLRKAVARDPGAGWAWYLLGVARLQQNDAKEALDCGYKCANTLETAAVGYDLVGRALMRQGAPAPASDAFLKALSFAPADRQTRDRAMAAVYALHAGTGMLGDLINNARTEDPTDFVPRALAALAGLQPWEAFTADFMRCCGEKEFTLLETAAFLMDLGLNADALHVLKALCIDQKNPMGAGPLPFYYLAYLSNALGKEADAKAYLAQAASMKRDLVFPGRVEEAALLDYAVRTAPNDAQAALLLGYLHAGFGRVDEALPLWEKAAALDASSSTAWRLLGFDAWKKKNDLPKAGDCYRKAIAARPGDQTLYRDLAAILSAQDKRKEAIALVEGMPKPATARADVILWLARAYLDEDRKDDCIHLLESTRFSNREGGTLPHDVFVKAHVDRGKARFEARQYDGALADFQAALTYPENLEVGAKYKLTDAETRYWLGKTLAALGRLDEAKAQWTEGAGQITSKDKSHVFVEVTPAQDEHVQRCATALEVEALGR